MTIELGYRSQGLGAAFDNPDPFVACIVGGCLLVDVFHDSFCLSRMIQLLSGGCSLTV
jgi:hypothetical protein